MGGRVALFDVDGTLLTENSGPLYARWLQRQGLLSRTDLLRSLLYALQYKFNLLDAGRFFAKVAARSLGSSFDAELERGRRFFDEVLRGRLRAAVCEAVERHRAAGDEVVILSASTEPIIGPIAAELDIREVLCTRLELDEARCYTGVIAGEPCFGEGKVRAAQSWCEARGLALGEAVAYADSMSDAPLLEAVAEPIVVEPDPLLRRLARQRGWPVLGEAPA